MTLEDINRAIAVEEKTEGETPYFNTYSQVDGSLLPLSKLIDICTTDILYAYTDELLSEALDRMGARGLHQLPVVDRDKTAQVLGLLEREQIPLTCNIAATRKALSRYLTGHLSVTSYQ